MTYLGHYELEVPYACRQLAYCYEFGSLNGTAHTHILAELTHPETKAKILARMAPLLQVPCQLNIVPHHSFGQLIKYHYGLLATGGKPRCVPGPAWRVGNFDYDTWVRDRLAHKRHGNGECAAKNRLMGGPPTY